MCLGYQSGGGYLVGAITTQTPFGALQGVLDEPTMLDFALNLVNVALIAPVTRFAIDCKALVAAAFNLAFVVIFTVKPFLAFMAFSADTWLVFSRMPMLEDVKVRGFTTTLGTVGVTGVVTGVVTGGVTGSVTGGVTGAVTGGVTTGGVTGVVTGGVTGALTGGVTFWILLTAAAGVIELEVTAVELPTPLVATTLKV